MSRAERYKLGIIVDKFLISAKIVKIILESVHLSLKWRER